MSLRGVSEIGSLYASGKFHYQTLVKTAIPSVGTINKWIDASMSTGIPKYNAWAGSSLAANQLFGEGNAGIFSGPNPSGSGKKYLHRWRALYSGTAPVPSHAMMCDYLLFYPLVDCDDDTEQVLENNVGLPRYTNSKELQMIMVGTVAGISNANVTVTYTNQDGVSGRTTTFRYITPSAAGVLTSSVSTSATTACPFIPLTGGDTGVRSVQSVQFLSPAGGFCTIAIVKPLCELGIPEASVWSERVFGSDTIETPPEIVNGAYLNLLLLQGAAQIGNMAAMFVFIRT